MWRTAPLEADLALVLILLLLPLVVVISHPVLLKLLPAELHVGASGLMMHKLLLLRLFAVLGMSVVAATRTTIINTHLVKRDAGGICAVWRL